MNVYVIGPANGPYKVGVANNVDSRLASLQTSSPIPLIVHFACESERAREHETAIHARLAAQRQIGEWFCAELPQIAEAFAAVGLAMSPEEEDLSDGMSATSFDRWLREMAQRPFYKSDAAAARLLGISANSVVTMKRCGCDRRTALACRALLHRLEPYA